MGSLNERPEGQGLLLITVSKESCTSLLQEVFDVNCLDANYNLFELF